MSRREWLRGGRTASAPRPPSEQDGADAGRRQLGIDMALGMVVLVVVGTTITANVGGAGGHPGPEAYVFGVGLGALMLVRRRWPVGVLITTAIALLVYYWLGYPPIGLAVPMAAALYSAAELGRTRWAIGVASALLGMSTFVRLRQGDDPSFVLGFELVSTVAMMAAVIALGDSIRSRRGWRAELGKQARAARQEREREAARRVEQERLRIARDLHDLLAHTVSVVSLHADVAREALRDDPDTAERSLTAVRGACGEVVRELRATLRMLRDDGDGQAPSELAPVPGLDQLDTLIDSATAAGLDVHRSTSGTPVALPAIADTTAYRIVQESLSNVVRHAGASNVWVRLHYTGPELTIRVRDDGSGAGTNQDSGAPGPGVSNGTGSTGWGIVGMRERLALLGGRLDVTAEPGRGFLVEAHIPIEEQHDPRDPG